MRGYYVVMYNNNKIYNNKITMGKNVYMFTVIYSHEKCDSIYLRRVSKKMGGVFPFKTWHIV